MCPSVHTLSESFARLSSQLCQHCHGVARALSNPTQTVAVASGFYGGVSVTIGVTEIPGTAEGGKGRRRGMKTGLDTKQWCPLGMTGPQTSSEPIQRFPLTSSTYIAVAATANKQGGHGSVGSRELLLSGTGTQGFPVNTRVPASGGSG